MTHDQKETLSLLDRLDHPGAASLHELAGWRHRHQAAVACSRLGFERAMVEMLRGWLRYADACAERYGSRVGDDGVLGPLWARIGDGLLGLLNGELGALDAGTFDTLIRDVLRDQGMDPEDL